MVKIRIIYRNHYIREKLREMSKQLQKGNWILSGTTNYRNFRERENNNKMNVDMVELYSTGIESIRCKS